MIQIPYLFNYKSLFLTVDNCYGSIFRCSRKDDLKQTLDIFQSFPSKCSFQHHSFYLSGATQWSIASIKIFAGDIFHKTNHPDKYLESFKQINMPVISLDELSNKILPAILKSRVGYFIDNSRGDGRLGFNVDHVNIGNDGDVVMGEIPVHIKTVMTNPYNILDLSRIARPVSDSEAYYTFTCIKGDSENYHVTQSVFLYRDAAMMPCSDITYHPGERLLSRYYISTSLPLGASYSLETNNVKRSKIMDNLEGLSI